MTSELGRVLWLTAFIVLQTFAQFATSDDCKFPGHTSLDFDKNIKRLSKMKGIRVSITGEKYSYSVGICTRATDDESIQYHAGVVQTDIVLNKHISSGSYDNSSVMAGTNWIMLEYGSGDTYHSHCGNQGRRSIIMMTCDPGNTEGTLRFIQENTNRTQNNCYYLFELDHQYACSDSYSILPPGLSLGSVIVIIFFSLAMLYLLGGFLYQRFMVGAKGVEQIPHVGFWQDFGNLQADGCNFICRNGFRNQPKTYKGIGDDQLTEELDDRDDNLLPM